MNTIAAAFVKAQKGFAPALKTSSNPHFKSRYADLSACVEAVIDSLNINGIGLIQVTHPCENGVIVETKFVHESGEEMSCGQLHVPAAKHDAQGYGSALTYARRYSLMAACGIAPEDDDGNAAAKAPANKHTPVKAAMQSVQIDAEQAEYLRNLAAELVNMVEVENKPEEAYELLSGSRLDSDDKVFLWDVLAPNSKTRSAIKKEGDKLKSKETA